MRILTAGDKNFYHCMVGLAKSVRKYYDEALIVYDLGLTDEQKANIDAEIIDIDIEVNYSDYVEHNGTDFITTTHKPFCIKHYFENNSEPLLYVDADCLFLEKVELGGCDVAVTVKPKRKRRVDNYFNGIINAGVIFFNSYPELLIDKWIEGCCKPEVTDQMVLAEMLSETIDWKNDNAIYDWHGLKVKTLKIEDYNDYYLRTGKIYHFKGDRHEGEIYKNLLAAINEGKDPYKLFSGQKEAGFKKFFRKFFGK